MLLVYTKQWNIVVPFIKIQISIDEHNKNVDDDSQKISAFTVIPQDGFGRISITIDKTVVT